MISQSSGPEGTLVTEQRRTTRHKAHVRVLFFRDEAPLAVDATCDNISTDGLFVHTRRRGPQAGTPVSLLLSFEGSDKELMVEGVVRWQGAVNPKAPVPDEAAEMAGMGIEFTEMEPKVRSALEENIHRLELESGSGSGAGTSSVAP